MFTIKINILQCVHIPICVLQLDDSQDIIVAFMYNGKLLTPDHGFPVRMIIPGYIGGRMIKWLTNIDLCAECSQDYYHFYDNRVFPSHVDAELALSEDWWHRSEYICNDLSVNSAIAMPAHDEELILTPNGEYKAEVWCDINSIFQYNTLVNIVNVSPYESIHV